MIYVRYIYSACIEISTADTSILCDPWFTEGIYDGTWYHFPKVTSPLKILKKADYIYVSHIHPDHYDPDFLKDYLKIYPKCTVLIAPFSQNYLAKKMAFDGIPFQVLSEEMRVGSTRIRIFANEMGSASDVDSALVVKKDDHTVVNLNDNFYNETMLDEVLKFCEQKVDIALLPYTGAGAFPQTYFIEREVLEQKANLKKQDFFNRYKKLASKLNPKIAIPFAGKYILGGKRSHLNEFRGVADPVEVLEFDPKAVVLADLGQGSINTSTLKADNTRTAPYSSDEIWKRIEEIKHSPLMYEKQFAIKSEDIQWKRLLPKAYANAMKYSELKENYFFSINLGSEFFCFNCNTNNPHSFFTQDKEKITELTPRSEISIDHRYLFGLITLIYHWNNAEIGSQFDVKRVPEEFNRSAQRFLNFFHL